MKRPSVPSRLLALSAAASVILSQSSVLAAEAASAPPPKSSGIEDFIKQSKQPASWFSWGADFRARNEYFNNALNLGDVDLPAPNPNNPAKPYTVPHEQDYFRFRMRAWATVTPVTNVSLFTRLAAEPRDWMRPASYTGHRGRSGGDWRYGILDNANVKYDYAFGLPLSIKAGRQDIQLGDFYNWWLTGDGTPGDGSWTFFLDSIRLTYQAKDIKTTFDMIYIYQNPWNNDWIPCFNNFRSYLTEQTEQGVVVYASNKSVKNMQIDPYFFYKHDRAELPSGDDAEIFTLGAKITGDPAEHWKYSVEGAYQLGQKKDPTVIAAYSTPGKYRDIGAFGVNASLTYLLKDKRNNQFSFAYEFLSGDDPSTKGDDEMFDVLWGRWPRYSELYLYSWANETSGKIGQHNNLHRIGPKWSINPMKNMTFTTMYNVMLAQEEIPTRATGAARNNRLFSNSGNFRGHYLQALVQHKFNPHISGHLWSEFVWMGDYYTQRDMMSFLRAEVLFTY